MIEVEQKITNACVICPTVVGAFQSLSDESRLQEAEGLALAIKLNVAYKEIVRIKNIKPATYLSQGFIERITPIISENKIELMIVDAKLSPIQQRNLEKSLKITNQRERSNEMQLEYKEKINTRICSLRCSNS